MILSDFYNKHIVVTANTSWCIHNFRGSVIKGLLDSGCQITIVAPKDKFSKVLMDMGCDFVDISLDRNGLSPLKDLVFLRRIKRIFASLNPDVVISYTIKNNIYGAIAAGKLDIPFIPMVPGLGNAFSSENWLQNIAIKLYRFAFKKVHKVLFLNEDNKDFFVEKGLIDTQRSLVIDGEGVDIKHFAFRPFPATGRTRVFLFCARLLYDKGVGDFVKAARIIRNTNPDAKFQVLGKTAFSHPQGVEEDVLNDWANEGVIEYLGVTDDVRPYLEAAHCVVLPSYYNEGMPRILMEAAAVGRAVITTDMPGCRDAVQDGQTGFLCDANDVDSLVGAIRNLIAMPFDDLINLGRDSRAFAQEKFDDRLKIQMYLDVLQSIFNENKHQQ